MNGFCDTITVFNFLPHPGGISKTPRLRRTVIKHAFWYPLYGSGLKHDRTDNDSVVVMLTDRPDCLPYKKWLEMGCPDGFFSLNAGDVIVRGEYRDIASVSEISGAEMIVVSAVRDCRSGSHFMRHWEVYGK